MVGKLKTDEGLTKQKTGNTSKYKTIRIHPQDFEFLRSWAYCNNSTVVNGISQVIQEYKNSRLQEKKSVLEDIRFNDDDHRNKFAEYVEQFPDQLNSKNLVAFYANAAVGIFSNDLKNPLGWIGNWSESGIDPSENYIHLELGKQQIINLAFILLKSNDKNSVIEELIKINPDYLLIAQELLRLNQVGMDNKSRKKIHMTKEEAQALAGRMIENSKKYGIPNEAKEEKG
ncbi:hypothetical protein [Bacillus sp. V2I10]|uniref:hypothetical protein n=1 Tax=Bacillus sp. V2I10 TaxID=3042276 RepID=UPI00278A50A2|nr:hypothetical protein [Bacillus sp. V2I10]MDQ0861095.1 hypothetical protein [Bacillus sp. V2I10]